MATYFANLMSGSSGNASLLDAGGRGMLIDFGAGISQLKTAFAKIGATWDNIETALLTHTHTDHWRESALNEFDRRGMTLWCHESHANSFIRIGPAFSKMRKAKRVEFYEPGETFEASGCRITPFELSHDAPTFGFRIVGKNGTIGYASDLGSWPDALVDHLLDVDLLALEFNHDVELEKASSRPAELIERVLGDRGHLSNEQAGRLLEEVVRRSAPDRLRHVVQLHLSKECNRPQLAAAAAEMVRESVLGDFEIHTASPTKPTPWLRLGGSRKTAAVAMSQPSLPGWSDS